MMDKDTLCELLRTKHYWPDENNPVYIKQMHLAKGMYADTHKHKYDHYGLLGAGKARVEIDGRSADYNGPCVITIKAGKEHRITAIENVTWFCIHGVDPNSIANTDIDDVLIKHEG